MRKWKLVAVLIPVLIGPVAVGLLALWPPSPLTRQIFHRIRGGMTRAEVESIIGAPWEEIPFTANWRPSVCSVALWCSPTGEIEVFFDAAGNVCDTHFNSSGAMPTWSERLALKWRKWFPQAGGISVRRAYSAPAPARKT
jgi:hypothetical protein